jgi:hypothetical protein
MTRTRTGTLYRIVVRGELGNRYAADFEGMQIQTMDADTILTGEVRDQPHLFGILNLLYSLGLELLSVQALSGGAHASTERDQGTSP